MTYSACAYFLRHLKGILEIHLNTVVFLTPIRNKELIQTSLVGISLSSMRNTTTLIACTEVIHFSYLKNCQHQNDLTIIIFHFFFLQ